MAFPGNAHTHNNETENWTLAIKKHNLKKHKTLKNQPKPKIVRA